MPKEENKKNKTENSETEKISTEEKKIKDSIENEIRIHSMPKRFLDVEPVVKQSKGIGALIFVGGGIVLVAVIAIMYYFLFMKVPTTEVGSEDSSEVTNQDQGSEEKKEPAINSGAQKSDDGNIKPEAEKKENDLSVTPDVSKNTTTDVVATTSKKVISSEIVEESEQMILKNADDLDLDGLFDKEEDLFSTDKNQRDSDGDGYEDLSEMMNMYNPAGAGALMVNDNIEKYSNSQYGFYFYYPKSWEIDKIDGNTSVIFKAKNNQFVQIIVQSNNKNQSLEEWYRDQFGVIRVEQKQKLYKKGWLAIESADGLSTYLMNPDNGNIFVMTYSIGMDNVLYYVNVYKMMIKSLEIE